MPTIKLLIDGKWYNISGSMTAGEKQTLLDEASEYAQQIKNEMLEEIELLNRSLTDLDDYIDNAFKDGIISEAEAKAIKMHLNTLSIRKAELDREYNDVYGNVYTSEQSKAILSSAKDLYDEDYEELVNTILDSISDSAVDEGEVSLVDQAFIDYANSISLLVSALRSVADQIGASKSDDALEGAKEYTNTKIGVLDERLISAESLITQNAREIQSRVTESRLVTEMASVKSQAVAEANEYAESLIIDANPVIGNLQEQIDATNEYVNNAFRDGIITALESTSIATYLNTLDSAKKEFDSSYAGILNNPYLIEGVVRQSFITSYQDLSTAHSSLIGAINTAIGDSAATPEERDDVNLKFATYNNCVATYRLRLEQAVDEIIRQRMLEAEKNANEYTDGELVPIRTTIENHESTITQHADMIQARVTKEVLDAELEGNLDSAKGYADSLKSQIEGSIDEVEQSVTDTRSYIDESFRDGIIYEAEYRKIQAHLKSMEETKLQFDNKYTEIHSNTWLTGVPKTDLSTAKTNYDTEYQNLVDAINGAIEDQIADTYESDAVNLAFIQYNNSIALLSVMMEKAIDSIAQARAQKIKEDAEAYVDEIKGDLDGLIEGLNNDIAATDRYIDGAFRDGIVTDMEVKKISSYINILNESKNVFDERYNTIYVSEYLTNTSYKMELNLKKTAYDNAYTSLITTIEQVIQDGIATGNEATTVDVKFSNYNTAVKELTASIEGAVDFIAQAKANKAQNEAEGYTDSVVGPIDSRLETAESTITQHADLIQSRVTRTEFFDTIEETKGELEGYTDGKLAGYVEVVRYTEELDEIRGQLDGQLESWFYPHDPTLDNEPAVNWVTNSEKQNHIGDTFTNTDSGYSWRFLYVDGSQYGIEGGEQEFQWKPMSNSDAQRALELAAKAQDTADNKRRVFTSLPYAPYDIGDLWVQGNTGDIMRCSKSKPVGGTYSASDWVKASKYTDDTVANNNLATAKTYAETKATEAKNAAESYAKTKAEAERVLAEAYADGKVTAEEQARINDVNAKLQTAKTYAETKATEAKNAAEAYVNTQLSSYVTSVAYNSDKTSLQTQIDGKVETWFYSYVPTLTNAPANTWTSNDLRDKHVNDLFFNTSTGRSYRFTKSSTTYSWSEVRDTDISKALTDASKAQDTADGKRRVFVSTPTTPYDVGDLWAQGTSGDLYKCKVARASGAYTASDWEKAVKYTDDTVANNNLATAKTYAETKATEAKNAAESYAKTKAEAERVIAEAYADGKVTAEEQARINDVNAKLTTAKTYAETKATEAKDAAIAYTNAELADYVTSVAYNSDKTALQTQIDGKIETWFYAYVPTLSNAPASAWTTTTERDKHVDDLFFNTSTGRSYRFTKSGTAYSWTEIRDTDISKALTDASNAKDTADSKRRVFVSTPVPPYEVGDLWAQGTTGDLYKCKLTRLTGSYASGDWEKATKYTDDTVANNNLNTAKTYAETKATEAKNAAESYAKTKAEAERVLAEAYADGVVDAEEQARISDVNAKLTTAKQYAESKATEAKDAAVAYANTQLANYVTTTAFNSDKSALQTQIDGKVESWFYGHVPSLTNAPASSWTTTADRDKHLNDLFFNTSTGRTYRFMKSSTTYSWSEVRDSDISRALTDASNAQDTADNKRRVFVSTPTTPYDVGDLWAQGTSGDLYRCKTARASGSYSSGDWEKATKYTDDTKADDLKNNVIPGLTSRLSSAEEKILPNAIVQTVTQHSTFKNYVSGEIGKIDVGSRNYALNTTWANDTSSWSVNGSWSRDVDTLYQGYVTMKVSVSGLTSNSWRALQSNMVPCVEGEQFTGSWFVYIPTSHGLDAGASMELEWFNSSGTRISTSSASFSTASVNLDKWVRHKVTATAPTGSVNVRLRAHPTKNGTFWVALPKLEKGNKDTDWSPAPEDISSALDDKASTTDLDSAQESVSESLTSYIDQKADSITQLITETVQTSEGNVIKHLESQLSSTVDAFDVSFTQISDKVQGNENELETVRANFTFTANGLEIGKSDSPLKLNISNDQIDFIDNGISVAYINGQTMYIDSLDVITSLEVGQHKIEKYNDQITLVRFIG
jgi:phage-related protein